MRIWKPGERAYVMCGNGSKLNGAVTGLVLDVQPDGILVAFDHGGGAWLLATEVYDHQPYDRYREEEAA